MALQLPLTAVPAVMVQLIAGVSPAWLLTVPLPSPSPLTLRVKLGVPWPANDARTDRDWVMVTLHVDAVPVQAPLQPVNELPGSGVALRSTRVFQPYDRRQSSGPAVPLVMTQARSGVSP